MTTKRTVLLLASVLAIAAFPPAAEAHSEPGDGTKTDADEACTGQILERPFLPWHDSGRYVLAPNGGLEDGANGWQLAGGATVESENEPFFVHAAADRHSLALPAGGSATTPEVCVSLRYPYMRFFAAGPSGASLKVEVLRIDSEGLRAKTIATLSGTGRWQAARRTAFSTSATTSRDEEHEAAVVFRFTAVGGSWRIDDVYVDPYRFG